jgi:hypothetical protein
MAASLICVAHKVVCAATSSTFRQLEGSIYYREEVKGHGRKLHSGEVSLGYSNQEGKMGEACSLHGRDNKCTQNFYWKT